MEKEGDPNRPVSEYSVGGGGGNLNRLPLPLPASLNNNNESTQMALYSDGRGMEAESDKNGAGGNVLEVGYGWMAVLYRSSSQSE